MELIYLWIDKYKNLNDTGVILNSAYEDKSSENICKTKNIYVKERIDHINIFGENLNIMTIVGKNGSGKSNIINALSYILRNLSACHNTKFYDEDQYDDNNIPKDCHFCLIIKANKKYIAYCSDNCINDMQITIENIEGTTYRATYNDTPNPKEIFKKKRLEQAESKINNVAKFQPFYRKDDTDPVDFTRWNGIYDITKIKLNNYFYYDRFRLYDTVRTLTEFYDFNNQYKLKIFRDNEQLHFNKYSPYLDIYEALDWAYGRIKNKSPKDGKYPIITAIGRAISRMKNQIRNDNYKNKSIDSLFEEVLPKLFFTYALGEIFNLIENYELDETLAYMLKDCIRIKTQDNNIINIIDKEPNSDTRTKIYKNFKRILFGKRPISTGLLLKTSAKLPDEYDSKRLKKMLNAYINYEDNMDVKNILKENYHLINGRYIQLKEPVNFEDMQKPHIRKIEALKGISKNLYNKREDSYDFMGLSTGEQRLMRFFADVYYCAAKLRNKYETNIFIFDEMDLSWHPEWQRKMIYYIKDLFDKLTQINGNKNRKFNLIFTTHSPFILSDMPKDNIIFLKDGKNVTQKVELQTFGANIHDLFNCGLFFECEDCYTLGEFAKDIIQNDILKNIEYMNESDQKNIEYKIKLIGEPLLKNALLEKLYSNDNYSPEIENIEHLKAKNKKLAQRVKELEKIIDNEKNKHK